MVTPCKASPVSRGGSANRISSELIKQQAANRCRSTKACFHHPSGARCVQHHLSTAARLVVLQQEVVLQQAQPQQVVQPLEPGKSAEQLQLSVFGRMLEFELRNSWQWSDRWMVER